MFDLIWRVILYKPSYSSNYGRVRFKRRSKWRSIPARLSCTPLWSMRVPLTRLLNGSKAVMLSMAGCFFPRYSYEPLHSEFRANTPLGTKRRMKKRLRCLFNDFQLCLLLNQHLPWSFVLGGSCTVPTVFPLGLLSAMREREICNAIYLFNDETVHHFKEHNILAILCRNSYLALVLFISGKRKMWEKGMWHSAYILQ